MKVAEAFEQAGPVAIRLMSSEMRRMAARLYDQAERLDDQANALEDAGWIRNRPVEGDEA